jgi:hypothetical protein
LSKSGNTLEKFLVDGFEKPVDGIEENVAKFKAVGIDKTVKRSCGGGCSI